MTRGVIYVAYGDEAIAACRRSVEGLRNAYPVTVVSDQDIGVGEHVFAPDADPGARWAKLSIDGLSPYDLTAYLDADTIPNAAIDAGFAILEDGWDMVITPSEKQDRLAMWHLGDEEKAATVQLLRYEPLQLQGGVIFFRKNEAVKTLFAVWREEWQRWREKDQGALLRALHRVPIKVWLLGRPWNGGSVIQHRFGNAVRKS